MKSLIRLVAAFCIINIYPVLSQLSLGGTCSQFHTTPKIGFLQNRYMGRWYIQQAYDYPDIKGADCITVLYVATLPGHANITEKSKNIKTNNTKRIDSLMEFKKPFLGQYIYKIPAQGVDNCPIDIISTDYTIYSIEWHCEPKGSKNDCYVWVMSRQRVVDWCFIERVNKILDKHNIDRSSMRDVIQNEDVCENEWK